MSLQHAAKHLASHGRGPDTELVHMTKGEINSLQTLAKAGGGSLTINPHTGLAEAGFLSKLLPMAAGAAAMYFSGGTAAPLLGGLGMGMSSAGVIGLGMGAFETARTGSLQKGLMAGLGAYGGAGLAGGLMGAGASAASNAAPVADAGIGAAQAPAVTNTVSGGSTAGQAMPKMMDYGLQSTGGVAPGAGSMAERIATAGANTGAGAGAASGMNPMLKYGIAAAAPALMTTTQQPETPAGDNKMPQRLQYNAGVATTTPPPDVPGYDNLGQDFGRQQSYFPNAGYQKISDAQAKEMRGYAGGGPVEAMSNANAIGANTGYPMADINKAVYSTPYQAPQSQNVVTGTADTGVNSMTGEMNEFADGGLNLAGEYSRNLKNDLENTYAKAERRDDKATMRSVKSESELRERLKNPKMYATGGLSDLGGYSDGGRLLRGPGDGVSDSIPATIGNKRPARLADGEFVVPARIVSELGNGSTEAGARKLYAMLDRVQSARKKSIGKGKVAKNSRADNLLPA